VAAPFFIDRTLTVSAWAPCLALGMLVQWAGRRTRVAGLAVGLLVAALVLPASAVFLGRHWEYDAAAARVVALARPGDVVATVPAWYSPLLEWRVGVRGDRGTRSTRVHGLAGARAFVLGGAAPTGRIWVLWFAGDHHSFPGFVRCASDWSDGVTALSCLAPA
jgi:tetrahydromethanopterin S-methyltransferase subunit F